MPLMIVICHDLLLFLLVIVILVLFFYGVGRRISASLNINCDCYGKSNIDSRLIDSFINPEHFLEVLMIEMMFDLAGRISNVEHAHAGCRLSNR